ncbi:hypothetical protein DM02DRAFT_534857 [Periconia macrospinosa]|uniref:UbiA prenyltransferase n=1 Tax=Periconia macrospinosa TaxID=97972 RepID=A0A2V1DHL9_9PLEO|nr:hypothetical protein DM02DRAFT_534857 [Periconia macrospinosa]
MSVSATYAPLVAFTKALQNLWLFTQDDFATFVIPNTVFGVCTALAGAPFVYHPNLSSKLEILLRIPLVIIFNWTNLFIFDLANQREAVEEDRLNKPWRPIPSGRMTRAEVRKAMQIAIPAVLAFNHYYLSTGAETACIIVGCWVYNDLKVSDDSVVLRNAIISLAFGVFNSSSLKVALGVHGVGPHLPRVAEAGQAWIWMYSAVIFTTMHVQDMKDQAGDKARGRNTVPLIFGDGFARWSLAVPITLWGPICALQCQVGMGNFALVSAFGAYVAWRCLRYKDQAEDRSTWQLWCAWTALLSLLPMT